MWSHSSSQDRGHLRAGDQHGGAGEGQQGVTLAAGQPQARAGASQRGVYQHHPGAGGLCPDHRCVYRGETSSSSNIMSLYPGRLWSNMLVFWLQKVVSVDASGQSRVFSVTGAGPGTGGRDTWERHREVILVREARPGDTGGVRSIR